VHNKSAPYAKIFFIFYARFATFSQSMIPRFPAFLAAVVFTLLLASCHTPAKSPSTTGPLVLISIDGFRWDYLQKYEAPTLQRLAQDGVHAKRMTSSFPSKTFPNHYTLVTGLRPENHGIVSNSFFDPALNRSFSMSNPANNTETVWWGGEPIWITAERQGVRSACFFWPGSEAPHNGLFPSFYKTFDKKLSSAARVDGVLAWLALPAEKRPRLATLYFDIVDSAGHKFGPDAVETGNAVKEVDQAIARLLDGLTKLGLRDSTSLVLVSDHGMTPVDSKRIIFLDDLMPLSTVQVESFGPNGGVRPKTGSAAELAARIRAKNIPHLQVYLREEVPERLHYRNNPRIPPVVLMADEGWNLEYKAGWPKRQATYDLGTHGYDPALPNMGALFIASGPDFQRGVEIPDVDNIHVYNLLCAALGITPAPNDGDQRLVHEALQH
jgi:predicted AlkP superfamily pyrophosphatase or phosphodiesterase